MAPKYTIAKHRRLLDVHRRVPMARVIRGWIFPKNFPKTPGDQNFEGYLIEIIGAPYGNRTRVSALRGLNGAFSPAPRQLASDVPWPPDQLAHLIA